MATITPILYGLSQQPKTDYPLYIQPFVPEVDQEGKLVTPEDHEHMIHGALLYDLVIFFHAQTVVEIGTRHGKSARIIIEALRKTNGHLTTIDCDKGTTCEEVSQKDQEQYVTRILNRDVEVEWTRPIDILFVDHSHDYMETRQTLEKFWGYIATPGALLIADGDSHFNQGQAVQDFAELHQLGYIADTRGQGHALFLKPSFPGNYRSSSNFTRHLVGIVGWNGQQPKLLDG